MFIGCVPMPGCVNCIWQVFCPLEETEAENTTKPESRPWAVKKTCLLLYSGLVVVSNISTGYYCPMTITIWGTLIIHHIQSVGNQKCESKHAKKFETCYRQNFKSYDILTSVAIFSNRTKKVSSFPISFGLSWFGWAGFHWIYVWLESMDMFLLISSAADF